MGASLADYLTYRATSSLARSNCCLAGKFSYVPIGATMKHECDGGKEEVSKIGWSTRFFQKIGMLRATKPATGPDGPLLRAG